MEKAGYVYIMASRRNGTIYIGSTSDLQKRVWEHRNKVIGGFTKRYGCTILVGFEAFDSLDSARHRELQMKEWERKWKLRVIEGSNPHWHDLYPILFPGEDRGPAEGSNNWTPAVAGEQEGQV